MKLKKSKYNLEVLNLWESTGLNKTKIAEHLITTHPELAESSVETVRSLVRAILKKEGGTLADLPESKDSQDQETTTETNQYDMGEVMSARDGQGNVMGIDAYCEFYGIDRADVKSWKLVTHTGTPFYNIASKSYADDDINMTLDEVKEIIAKGLETFRYTPKKSMYPDGAKKVDVIKLADLHFGAYIDGLIKTKDYSINILAERLSEIAETINSNGADEVHIHLLGDLIESFTGLNHKNSWKGLQKGMIGAEAVKLCTEVLHDSLLSRITNLMTVKVVGGNHDRLTSDNKEDTDAGAADLISWGLKLIGYDIEFNPFVITHVVDGICHILMHGDKPVSKKSTKDICFDYGRQNMFNLLCEGHLHSIIEKLSVKQRLTGGLQIISDDSVDHRRMICPSIFTGNSYSEYLGYTSNAGFVITRNNGRGVPHVFYYAL